ncbi:pyridoxamine 5'-phosphate oxidase family protein [Crenobacter cavernae]|uniref:Pyridoxamine 5'-phosphate oxidase family protein n=1 Tax=Crenobacter cavernae TaxID=2290923 RepID=A0ABY0FAL1_9NEIS|nr:pyridoxamine 5'-phosphate oxidase family protein [Crenobacter cavernae]RXZ42621.1 pyridoxamine 5'-phosphate oxidase family protein [Crenobacter cavernae]
MTRHEIYEFLRLNDHAVLATVGADGRPEAALVGFIVTPALELVLDTSQLSRKYQNLRLNPQVALVIGWKDKVTLQYEGTACEPVGDELAHCKQAYFAHFPDGPEREGWPDIAYLLVRPRWLRYSDFGREPPQIIEMTLAD